MKGLKKKRQNFLQGFPAAAFRRNESDWQKGGLAWDFSSSLGATSCQFLHLRQGTTKQVWFEFDEYDQRPIESFRKRTILPEKSRLGLGKSGGAGRDTKTRLTPEGGSASRLTRPIVFTLGAKLPCNLFPLSEHNRTNQATR